jgi:hypothetical protein
MADAAGSTSQGGAILHDVVRLAGRHGCGGRPTDGWQDTLARRPAVALAVDVAALLRNLHQRERFDEKNALVFRPMQSREDGVERSRFRTRPIKRPLSR